MSVARPICLQLLRQEIARAFSRAWANTGNRIAARIAMIAMTTSNSISVNADFALPCMAFPFPIEIYDRSVRMETTTSFKVSWDRLHIQPGARWRVGRDPVGCEWVRRPSNNARSVVQYPYTLPARFCTYPIGEEMRLDWEALKLTVAGMGRVRCT